MDLYIFVGRPSGIFSPVKIRCFNFDNCLDFNLFKSSNFLNKLGTQKTTFTSLFSLKYTYHKLTLRLTAFGYNIFGRKTWYLPIFIPDLLKFTLSSLEIFFIISLINSLLIMPLFSNNLKNDEDLQDNIVMVGELQNERLKLTNIYFKG